MLCQEQTKINKDFVKPGPGDNEVKLSGRKHSAFSQIDQIYLPKIICAAELPDGKSIFETFCILDVHKLGLRIKIGSCFKN